MRAAGTTKSTAVLALAAIMLGACGTSASRPVVPVATQETTAAITSVEIDRSGLRPLAAPLNIGIKPTKPVDHTIIARTANGRGYQFVAKGQTYFERLQDGKIAQHFSLRSGALENPSNGDKIPMNFSLDLAYEFDETGEIWSIRKPVLSIPSTKPSDRLSDEQWSAFRKQLEDEYSYESGNIAFECAAQVFGLNGQSVGTGFPMAAQNVEQLITRISVCTLAAIRGGDPIAEPEYREQLLAATPSELAAILEDTKSSYRDQFTGTLKYSSDAQIRGSVTERGQEFLLAEGTTRVEFQGVTIISNASTLIDPFTGLPYKARNRTSVTADTNASDDAKSILGMNGTEVAILTDLPQAVPELIAISEPKPSVIASTGSGSLSDIYSRSINAVYLVAAGKAFGTGFTISSTDAVTSAHVVEGSSTATLAGSGGKKFEVAVVAVDSIRDIALLRIKSGAFPASLPISRDLPTTGAQVAVIGCPFDPALCGTLTTGIVSFSNRPVDGISHIQVDAAINQGNSGGPILNLNGEVIGIAEFKVADPSFVGLSFGLASTEIRQFLNQQQVVLSALPTESSAP
jgi:serine protease Do